MDVLVEEEVNQSSNCAPVPFQSHEDQFKEGDLRDKITREQLLLYFSSSQQSHCSPLGGSSTRVLTHFQWLKLLWRGPLCSLLILQGCKHTSPWLKSTLRNVTIITFMLVYTSVCDSGIDNTNTNAQYPNWDFIHPITYCSWESLLLEAL